MYHSAQVTASSNPLRLLSSAPHHPALVSSSTIVFYDTLPQQLHRAAAPPARVHRLLPPTQPQPPWKRILDGDYVSRSSGAPKAAAGASIYMMLSFAPAHQDHELISTSTSLMSVAAAAATEAAVLQPVIGSTDKLVYRCHECVHAAAGLKAPATVAEIHTASLARLLVAIAAAMNARAPPRARKRLPPSQKSAQHLSYARPPSTPPADATTTRARRDYLPHGPPRRLPGGEEALCRFFS
ncbi:hypothetical protein C8R45DRAFT_1088018 [Mycena sanguinolenta]|nr:hypothetical protein C8R45DRAFT_1088018 [Mycena sanguinolenta]